MNYSNDDSMVRVDFFKPSGKWYETVAVKFVCYWSSDKPGGMLVEDAFVKSLELCMGDRLKGMTAVCLEPYHEHTHPLMVVYKGISND
jgi:hypothetical protein